MKKYIISLFVLSSIFASCSDFLDEVSQSALSNETFWSDEKDATEALAGCYDALQQEGLYFTYPGWATASPRELEFATDNGFFLWIPWLAPDEITTNTLSPTSNIIWKVWQASYAGIARCNAVVQNVPQIPEDKIDKETASQIVCEAKFIRALLYNHLTSLYRDVPFTTEVLTVATSQLPKSPKAEIVEKIAEDLKEIAGPGKLPQAGASGRATQGAAWALLCRIYLYNNNYAEAIEAAKQVIVSGEYELASNFSTLFTEAGNTDKEIIYSIRFKNTDPEKGEGGWLSYNYGYPMEWLAPYKNLADDFYCIDGKPIGTSPLYDPDNDASRDPRLTYSLITPNGTWYGEEAKDALWIWNSPVQHYVRKYQTGPNWGIPDNQDFYVIRYADVLLMYAEALANLSQDKGKIMSLVNEVRRRADVMMPTIEEAEGGNLSFEQLLDVIKHERRVELAFEGCRYFDLLRWKGMEAAYAKCREENVGGSHIFDSSKGYVWPIPQSELDNNKNLIQAPEWGGR